MSQCADKDAALLAAYREASGLAAVVITANSDAVRIAAVAAGSAEANGAHGMLARWWCRRLRDAERVAAAAAARSRQRESNGGAGDEVSLQAPGEAVEAAAKRLNIALRSDSDVTAEAVAAIARVEAELQRLMLAGDLKSVNRAYRTYRIEATARGERVLRYADWMSQYKEKLVRDVAAALRYF